MMTRRLKVLAAALALSMLIGCEAENPITTGTNSSTPLDTQLDEAARLNQQSARNSLQQAQNLYFQLSAPLINLSTDVQAYQRINSELLPAMLSAANSLTTTATTDTDTASLKADFQELFSDVMTQAVLGINTNLSVYQGLIEAPQSLDGSTGSVSSADALQELTDLFQATEYTERFAAQLNSFPTLLSNASSVLNGIRNQQSVVINGVLRLSERVKDTSTLQQSYQTLVKSLTRPELLSSLSQLARRAYGDTRVALRQSELTPTQTDPNQVQMVIQEDASRYRLIRISEGRLINEVTTDTRGLSASDLLFQSNVVVVRNPQQQP
jgi:hypothetical protein